MSDVIEQVVQRHPEVKNEGIPEMSARMSVLTFAHRKPKLPDSRAGPTKTEVALGV